MTEKRPVHVEIDYLARVEGEAALSLKVEDGRPDIMLKIWEPPRFFEGFLVGRKFDEVGDIVSRICGICPISHMTTALQAVETAMGIHPSLQTRRLRRLMCISQIVASHVVHLYMLAFPDYHGHPDFLSMLPSFRDEVKNFMAMKQAVNRIGEVIGGRALHPVSMVVDGFTLVPSRGQLLELAQGVEAALPMAERTIGIFRDLPVPDLQPETEYFALRSDGEYGVNEGHLVSSRGFEVEVRDYSLAFEEKQVPYAMAKKSFTRSGNPPMVGALARVNLKQDQLKDRTRRLMDELEVRFPSRNPYHNLLAQAVEVYDGMLECIQILEELHPHQEKPRPEIRAGEGLALTEAPRGLLMHRYAIDRKGVVEDADLVTPTSHNFAKMEDDLRLLARRYGREDSQEDLRLKCEQLIRAYDPCFSCSVH